MNPLLKKPILNPSDVNNYKSVSLLPQRAVFLHTDRTASWSSVVILLDLSAVSDTVNHQILFSTLQELGVLGFVLSLFTSYLKDSTYWVRKNLCLNLAPLLLGCLKVLFWVPSYFLFTPSHSALLFTHMAFPTTAMQMTLNLLSSPV